MGRQMLAVCSFKLQCKAGCRGRGGEVSPQGPGAAKETGRTSPAQTLPFAEATSCLFLLGQGQQLLHEFQRGPWPPPGLGNPGGPVRSSICQPQGPSIPVRATSHVLTMPVHSGVCKGPWPRGVAHCPRLPTACTGLSAEVTDGAPLTQFPQLFLAFPDTN